MKMEQSSSSEAEEAEMREEALKYALLNALKYGEPDEKAVIKRILAEHPEWRKSARELRDFVREAVSDVAEMSKEEREAELMRLSPELAEELRGEGEKKGGGEGGERGRGSEVATSAECGERQSSNAFRTEPERSSDAWQCEGHRNECGIRKDLRGKIHIAF
ncbi:MAG: hypothetical protein MW690_001379 [Methanophagales archaeon]|nr:hypothetical protein [Methanophagales archaeon]